MKDNFADCLKRVLVSEGGYVNDPDDPGGETNFGITAATYAKWQRTKGVAKPKGVRFITADEVAAIYKSRYWDTVHGDDLPSGIDYCVFDASVNSGPGKAIQWAQVASGVTPDAVYGRDTASAIEADPDNDAWCSRFCAKRLSFMRALKIWGKFGKGWTSRVNHVLKVSQAMATGSVGPAPVQYPNSKAKALQVAAKPLPNTGLADSLASGGAVATTLSQVTSALQPASELPHVAEFLAFATAAGVLITAGGGALAWYQRKKRAERSAALDIITHPSQVPEGAGPEPEAV